MCIRDSHCGQLNGTSGYEEAAAQGLIAGINAARRAHGAQPLRLGRETSYVGVLIDDLVTRGVDEPYRMLTSRAEHRVVLRHDNADLRLTPIGREIGLVDDRAWESFERRRGALEAARRYAESARVDRACIGRTILQPGATLADALRRPDVAVDDVLDRFPAETGVETARRVEIELKMDGYVRRAQAAIERAARDEAVALPGDLDYAAIPALSREAREKLDRTRPRTLGAATRIPGITPTDVALVSVHVHRLSCVATAAPA